MRDTTGMSEREIAINEFFSTRWGPSNYGPFFIALYDSGVIERVGHFKYKIVATGETWDCSTIHSTGDKNVS